MQDNTPTEARKAEVLAHRRAQWQTRIDGIIAEFGPAQYLYNRDSARLLAVTQAAAALDELKDAHGWQLTQEFRLRAARLNQEIDNNYPIFGALIKEPVFNIDAERFRKQMQVIFDKHPTAWVRWDKGYIELSWLHPQVELYDKHIDYKITVGPFRAYVIWSKGREKMVAKLRPLRNAQRINGILHPHALWEEDSICLGPAALPLSVTFQTGQWADAVNLMTVFLNGHNDGGSSTYQRMFAYAKRREEKTKPYTCPTCGWTGTLEDKRRCNACAKDLCTHCQVSCNTCGTTLCNDCFEKHVGETCVHCGDAITNCQTKNNCTKCGGAIHHMHTYFSERRRQPYCPACFAQLQTALRKRAETIEAKERQLRDEMRAKQGTPVTLETTANHPFGFDLNTVTDATTYYKAAVPVAPAPFDENEARELAEEQEHNEQVHDDYRLRMEL